MEARVSSRLALATTLALLAAAMSTAVPAGAQGNGNAEVVVPRSGTAVGLNQEAPSRVIGEYRPSVIETESPSQVRRRAEDLLATRFVDIWLADEEQSYVIGVTSLREGESEALAKALTRSAPLTIVEVPVERRELEEVLDRVLQVLQDQRFSAAWVDYTQGAIRVTVPTVGGEEAKSAIGSVELAGSRESTSTSAPQILVSEEDLPEEEDVSVNPYRAGKRLSIGQTQGNCTTGFLVKKNGLEYGLTAGHCGPNGTSAQFAAIIRGNIQNNTLWASNPANSDAALFRMANNGTPTFYRSPSKMIDVEASFATPDIVVGLNVCTKGSFSPDRTCGRVTAVKVTTFSNTAGRDVKNGYRWSWAQGAGTVPGDSGAPVYRTLSNGNVVAVGVHRAGNLTDTSVFTPIRIVLAETGSNLARS
jgi:V8-like Glu-specific endopeptidase